MNGSCSNQFQRHCVEFQVTVLRFVIDGSPYILSYDVLISSKYMH
jgi:hypothetical protein